MANAGYFNAPTRFNTLPKFHTPTDTSAAGDTGAELVGGELLVLPSSGRHGDRNFDLRPELSLPGTAMIDAHVGNVCSPRS
ncbi:MAG: hypothetical protein IPK32_19360 [Verrucomicrobiaceae bacterium]|nr:hypothetical protein [Verrucomicrobiaceae bacterium]